MIIYSEVIFLYPKKLGKSSLCSEMRTMQLYKLSAQPDTRSIKQPPKHLAAFLLPAVDEWPPGCTLRYTRVSGPHFLFSAATHFAGIQGGTLSSAMPAVTRVGGMSFAVADCICCIRCKHTQQNLGSSQALLCNRVHWHGQKLIFPIQWLAGKMD